MAQVQPLQQMQEIAKKLGRTDIKSLTVKDLHENGMSLGDAIVHGSFNAQYNYGSPEAAAAAQSQAKPSTTTPTQTPKEPQGLPDPTEPKQPAPSAQAAPQVPRIPQAAAFDYKANTRTDAQLLAAARARANLLIGTQRQDVQAGFAQQQAAAQQNRDALARQQGGIEERNRSQFAASGLGTSGFMAGANALSQAATVGEVGKVNQQEELARQALVQRLSQLNQLQRESEVANYDQLLQQERTFGLQDRAQQFGEFSSNRDFGLRQADLGSVLAQRAFDLQRGQQLLPYELQGAGLSNQQAAFSLSRGQQMLPYELQSAGLANQTAQAQYQDQYTQGGLGYQYRQGQITGQSIANQTGQFNLDSAKAMQPIQQRAGELANEQAYWSNQIAMLNYQIANDPDLGARQQAARTKQEAEQKMRLVEAQIAQVNAETANIGKTGGTGGMTPYQQWQIESSITEKEQAARDAQVKQYTGSYGITPIAGELWVDLNAELNRIQSQSGKLDKDKANELLRDLKTTPGITDQDTAWLDAMFDARFGDIGAPSRLRTYLKGYKPPEDAGYEM